MSARRVLDPDVMQKLVTARDGFQQHADALRRLLSRTGSVLDHHFELQSGAHAQYFLRFADAVRRPEDASTVAKVFSGLLPKDSVLLCPESSGVALAAALRDELGVSLAVVGVDQHRRPLKELRSGDVKGRKTYVVNDVVTTGSSLEQLAIVAREHGGELAGAIAFAVHEKASLETRPGLAGLSIHIPLTFLWKTYSAPCPLCSTVGPAIPALELN